MRVVDIGLGVIEIVPEKFGDARGYFVETWQRDRFVQSGISPDWIQDNQSFSVEPFVLRGLHVQLSPYAQDKLVRVLSGKIFDVAVDVRPGSPSFGQWVARELSADDSNQLFIPKGFAHGFLTLTPAVAVLYKVSAPYDPDSDRSIAWNDPMLGITWPLPAGRQPQLSAKDRAAPPLSVLAASLAF
jgi:dTDP-4-dehydrorhamnose 3,5-epimerase